MSMSEVYGSGSLSDTEELEQLVRDSLRRLRDESAVASQTECQGQQEETEN